MFILDIENYIMKMFRFIILLLFLFIIQNSFCQINDKSVDFRPGQVVSIIGEKSNLKLVLADKTNEFFISTVIRAKNEFISNQNKNEQFKNYIETKTEYGIVDILDVLVNNENGFIKKGDVLMVSSTPGTAMKSNRSGMMVGIALEDQNLKQKTALIKCRIMIQYYCGK
jgi:hypothetical protein